MQFLEDFRYAVRRLWKDRAFTSVVVLALAMGIGTNTTVFTLVNAVLFKGLPFEDPDRILHLNSRNVKESSNFNVSLPDYRDWKEQGKVFNPLAAYEIIGFNLSDGEELPERFSGARMTPNAFSVIRVKPALGRDFEEADAKPGAQLVAILGYSIWQNRYSGKPDILGKTIRLNEVPTTVIGVMPKGFKFPVGQDVWTQLLPTPANEKRDARILSVFGRLAPGSTLAEAKATMNGIASRLEKAYEKENKDIGVNVETFNDRFNGGNIKQIFLVLMGAVGFLLLIACANVSNLLLARAVTRGREISIRTALGASRWQVVRQLLTESILLGFLGGLAGLFLSYWGVRGFSMAVADVGKPYWIDFSMDLTVFGYLAAICIGTGILFGLVPALRATKVDLNEMLKDGGRGTGARTGYLSSGLVVIELGLALVLLIGAGLMMRSFMNLNGLGNQYNADHILTMRMNLVRTKYVTPNDRFQFAEKLLARLKALPGVERVAITSNLPLNGSFGRNVELEGNPPVEPGRRPATTAIYITPEYFRVLGKPLLRGREFEDADGLPGREVVIVNQRFVEKYFPGQEAIGKRFRMPEEDASVNSAWVNIVGVALNARQDDPTREIEPLVYITERMQPLSNISVMARTTVDPITLATPFRKAVQELDADLPVFDPWPMQQSLERQRWPFRVFGTMFTLFALMAIALASVGIYAVMSYSVNQRRQEIGIRMALGSSASGVVRLMLRKGLIQLALGLTLGLGGSILATRALSVLLVDVKSTDPLTYGVLALLLGTITLAACLIPARRAAKVDPLVALRYE